MNKLSKEKRERLLLVALGTGSILAALYLLLASPMRANLQDCAQRLSAAQEKLSKAELWQRMAGRVHTELQDKKSLLESQEEGLAPVDKFKWFYGTLEPFLRSRPVKLIDITRDPEIGSAGVLPNFPYQAATFGVKVTARFQDFGAFLADFENAFPFLRVQDLEIEPEAARLNATENKELEMPPSPESLAVTLHVVVLIKPTTPLYAAR